MNLPHIDSHPRIKQLLDREAELRAQRHAARIPAPPPSARELLDSEARRLLGDDPPTRAPAADPATLDAALRELDARIRAARTQARAELLDAHHILDRAAASRQAVADAAVTLLERLQNAEEFALAMAFAELDTPATWPGSRRGLRDSLASFTLSLAEAGATVATALDLPVLAGVKAPDLADWECSKHVPAVPQQVVDYERIVLE